MVLLSLSLIIKPNIPKQVLINICNKIDNLKLDQYIVHTHISVSWNLYQLHLFNASFIVKSIDSLHKSDIVYRSKAFMLIICITYWVSKYDLALGHLESLECVHKIDVDVCILCGWLFTVFRNIFRNSPQKHLPGLAPAATLRSSWSFQLIFIFIFGKSQKSQRIKCKLYELRIPLGYATVKLYTRSSNGVSMMKK